MSQDAGSLDSCQSKCIYLLCGQFLPTLIPLKRLWGVGETHSKVSV